MIAGPRAREAFDLSREPQEMRDRYGTNNWCQQALLARRLVEAGVKFVTIDLSNHGASGTWDTHGDNIPPYGGISSAAASGFDHLATWSPTGKSGPADDARHRHGRRPHAADRHARLDRWPQSLARRLVAHHGRRRLQARPGHRRDRTRRGQIKRPVTPSDLAATIFHHFGVASDAVHRPSRPAAVC
jgi:hypothetical protein